MPRPARLLVSLLSAALLALVLVPLTARPAAAAPTIVGIAVDAQGTPLKNVHWDVFEQIDGQWVGLQFGPKLTDDDGRFEYSGFGLAAGETYRICFSDSYYGISGTDLWYPEVRHRDTCWGGATSVDAAQDWTATDGATTFTVTMPVEGLGMAPVDPFVTGSFAVGQPLTVVGQDGWRPTTATLDYQWYAGGDTGLAPIAAATAATYTPTAADSGKWIQARVTATLAGYKPAVLVSPVTKVGGTHAQIDPPLTISGTAAPGSTVTASFGKPAASYSEIRWFVDGIPQPDATTYDQASGSFAVTAAMSGARIEARLKAYLTDAGGNYVDGSDAFGRAVVQAQGARPPTPQPLAAPPAVTSTPVSGTTAVGATLSAPGGITADPDATTTYQWLRDDAPIPGATSASYRLQPADIGHRISVAATVARPGWWSGFLRTTTTSEVVRGVLPAGRVKVKANSGAKVGARLKAKVSGWDRAELTYRWLRNGKAIKPAKKAGKASYKLTRKDRGKRITVVVTASRPNYLPATATSKAKRIKR